MSTETETPKVQKYFEGLRFRAMHVLSEHSEHLSHEQLALLGQVPMKSTWMLDNWNDSPKLALAVMKRVSILKAQLARLGISLHVH